MIALPSFELTDLWFRAIDLHEQQPLTRPAALAAHALQHEDLRRRRAGIPSIFEDARGEALRRFEHRRERLDLGRARVAWEPHARWVPPPQPHRGSP
jgi:hypothetical protein